MRSTAKAFLFGALLGCLVAPRVGAGASNVVIDWNNATLQAVHDTKPGPPMVARALAIVHTAIYDAWAAYDPVAVGLELHRPSGAHFTSRWR